MSRFDAIFSFLLQEETIERRIFCSTLHRLHNSSLCAELKFKLNEPVTVVFFQPERILGRRNESRSSTPGAVTSLNSLSMVTSYTPPCLFGMRSKIDVPSTAMSRRCNRLVLLHSEHRLQIFQQLRTTLMSLTTCQLLPYNMASPTLTTV